MFNQVLYILDSGRMRLWVLSLLCLILLFPLLIPTLAFAQPTGFQEYHVLGYEEHIWRAFLDIYDGPDDHIPGRICSTVSLVATADYQVIYYDHWEDGYEADLLTPIQPTTRIYGDGDPSNGGTGSDLLHAGDDISLISDQNVTGPNAITGYVPVASGRDPAYIRYDGGDRVISSGGPVDLTHAMWPLNNSWAGGAWEIYSRQAYDDIHSYHLPVGEDLYELDSNTYGDFRNVYLQLESFEDNTTVRIDNGTEIIAQTLNRGQTYFSMGYVDSTTAPAIPVNSGTIIRSSGPIQVGLITGANSPPTRTFQGRFLIILPDLLWGADYVVPVPSSNVSGSDDQAEVYLSNPNSFPITVNAYDRFAQNTFVIGPAASISSTVAYSSQRGGYVPADTAARFTSSDGAFDVVVCADTSDTTYDWGFSGISSRHLTQDYYVSWAPGDYNTPPQNNGSPVWVTTLANDTTFYVDFNTDPGGLDGTVDETFTLDVLEQRRIFDPDNDNTGIHVWATGEFAVAWGEDPRTADATDPYLDLGVALLSLQEEWLEPVLTLGKTAEPTILPPAGGTVTFTLVAEAHDRPLVNVDITDTLPISWTYVPSSTHITYPDGSTANPDPAIDDQTLFWAPSTDLDIDQILTLTFQAQITNTGGVGSPAYDGFESGDYSGGINWAGDWQEVGDDDDPTTGDILVTTDAPFAGSYHLRIQEDSNEIIRTVDLSSSILPVLRFNKEHQVNQDNEHFYLDVYDGANWTYGVLDWANGGQEGTYVQELVDLAPYANAATAIRFRSSGNLEASDYLYIDQIKIYETGRVNFNQGEAIGKHRYSDKLFNPADEAKVYISFLDLTKTVNSTQAEIGDTLVYTLSYTNTSSSITATNVVLRDPVPIQHVALQSYSSGGTFDGASGTVSWDLGTLTPGASGVVTFAVTVNNFVRDGTIIKNIGYVNSDQTVEAGSNVIRTDVLAPDIEFHKSGPTVAARGQVITYTLSYENVGRRPATGVTIHDIIPASATYVTGSLAIHTGSGWLALTDAADADQGAYISPTLSIIPGVTPGTIVAGETGQIRFSVRLDDDLPSGSRVLNWATLDRDLSIPRDSNLVATIISDLLIRKAAEQTTVTPGGVISYHLTYGNSSQIGSQTNVYVYEPIPDYTRLIPGTVYGGDIFEYSWNHGITWSTTPPITPATHIRWYDAELPPSTQETVGFAVQVNDPLLEGTTIRNMARIASTQTGGEMMSSNQVEVGTVDLWVEKSVNSSTARAGDPVSYTISYGNHGSADALGVQIRDIIPTGAAYSPGTIWGTGADDGGNPILVWNVTTVAAGASAQRVGYTVVLDPALAADIITNTAVISDIHGVKTSDPVTVSVTTEADVAVTKSDDPDHAVVAGATLTYTLVYTNSGPSDAQNIVITDTLPDAVTYGGVVDQPPSWSDPPTYTPGPPATLAWYTPTLAADASGTIVFTVTVDADAGGILTNSAVITSATTDVNPVNNTDDEGTIVIPWIDLSSTTYSVGEGEGPAIITVTLSATSIQTATVNYATSDGTATAGEDYAAISGTLAFGPGTTMRTFAVPITNDALYEADENLDLTLSDPVNANLGTRATAVLTITDDDASERPTAYFATASQSGAEDVGTMTIVTELDRASGLDATVPFTIMGTATEGAGQDYVITASPVVIPTGSVTTTIVITVHDDSLYEADETVIVTMGTPLNADRGTPAVHTATITDDDVPGTPTVDFSSASYVVDESAGAATITITLGAVSDLTATVAYATSNGTATAGEDYTTASGTLTFSPGMTETIFTVDITADWLHEDAETVTLTLSSPVNASLDGNNPAALTILDDDPSDLASIYGIVFDDVNLSGNWEQNVDAGLPGVLVTLDGAITTTTDANGLYHFSTGITGTHVVSETDPLDYFSITPNEIPVVVERLGRGYEVNFADAPTSTQAAAIHGIVFDDVNINADWDKGEEPGIPGVLITLDSAIATTTDANGSYAFTTTVTGTYTVIETDPDGYYSTTPNRVPVTVTHLGNSYEVRFGDAEGPAPAPSCEPDSYEDDDVPGQAAGLSMGVRQEHNFCKDATDWITLTAQAGDIYVIATSSWGPRADTFLALFDTDSRTLLAGNDDHAGTTDYSSRIVWQAPASGVYYVRTTNRAGLIGDFTDYGVWVEHHETFEIYLPLAMRNYEGPIIIYLPLVTRNYGTTTAAASDGVLYPTGIISHTCPDAYEIDDTREQARPIEAGVAQVHSFDSDPLNYAADKDFVWFDLWGQQTVTFTIAGFTDTLTLLELYDADGSALNVTGTTQLTWTATTIGHYYLSTSPLVTDTFGCSYEVGYDLLAEMSPVRTLYLPRVVRNSIL